MSQFLSPRLNSFQGRLASLNWLLVALITSISLIGVMMLYSVADGFEPWSIRHLTRLIVGLAFMITVAILDIKFWFRIAYFVYVIGSMWIHYQFIFRNTISPFSSSCTKGTGPQPPPHCIFFLN